MAKEAKISLKDIEKVRIPGKMHECVDRFFSTLKRQIWEAAGAERFGGKRATLHLLSLQPTMFCN